MTKRALLIGCNYSTIPGAQLKGCINDVVNVRNMLVDAYGYSVQNMVVLRDDNPESATTMPTRSNILAGLKDIVAKSVAGDEIWIHFSGHGTQVNDKSANPDEAQDETIVPCDFKSAGLIIDDEIFDIIKDSVATTIIAFDSCHSGTAVDLGYSINYDAGKLSTVKNNAKSIANPNIFMFSGCRDNQTSADAFSNFEKEPIGAFTDAFLETLRLNQHNATIIKVYTDVCSTLAKTGFSQIPSLSSTTNNPSYTFQRFGAPAIANPPVKPQSTVNPPAKPNHTPVVIQQIPIVKPQSPAYIITPKPKPAVIPMGSVFYKVQNNSTSKLSPMPLMLKK